MTELLVNIDVADLAAAEQFYCGAFDLKPGRRFGNGGVELLGGSSRIYLLAKAEGSLGTAAEGTRRSYARHWTPVHLDFVVEDIDGAIERSLAAGATREMPLRTHDWGQIAVMVDPFGHGYCLIQFTEAGYDAVADAPEGARRP